MPDTLTKGLFPNGFSREKAASLTASIAVNLAMIVAFASIANIDGDKLEQGSALVVVGLSGAESESEPAEAQQAASLPAPPPPAPPAPPSIAPDFVKKEEPIDQKIALLRPPEPVAERTDGAPPEPQADSQPSPEQLRKAAERQRQAQEAAKIRAAEQAQTEAREARSQSATKSDQRAAGSGGYKAQVWQHLQRFRRPNTIGAGTTLVRFRIDDGGGVSGVGVARSSGSASFDREALQMVRRAAPFPKPPQDAGRDFVFAIEGQ